MAFPVLGQPLPQFVDSNGDPLNGGTLEIRDPISNANKSTYPTAADADAATNANSADISLNIRGEPEQQIWGVDDEEYKVTLKDSSGVTIWTATDIAWDLPVVYSSSMRIRRTSAETSAGVAEYAAGNAVGDIVNPEYEPGDIRRYGADTGAADNTAAIQAAVNQCSHGGPNVYVPVGKFVHTSPIYYYYDATNNTGFIPYVNGSTDYLQGHISVYGERAVTRNAWSNGVTNSGSELHFDPASSTGDGHKVGNDTLSRHRHYQFHNITISGETSGSLIKFKGSSQKTGIWNSTIFQAGTGSGVKADDCWEFHIHETIVESTNVSNAGWGVKIWQSTNGAGNYVLMNSNFKGFQYGAEIGEYDYASGTFYTVQNVLLYCVELGGTSGISALTDVGLRLGEHIETIICDGLYIENCTDACVRAAGQQQNIILRGGTYGLNMCTDNAIVLGVTGAGDPAAAHRQECVLIEGVKFSQLQSNLACIERNVGANTGSLIVRNCNAGPKSSTGTKFLEINGDGAGVSLEGNDLYDATYTYPSEWTATTGVIDYYRSGNLNDGTLGDTALFGVWVNKSLSNTSGGDLDMAYPLHKINSSGGGFTLEVQDGFYDGHEITFVCNNYGSNVDIDFNTDSTKDTGFGATGQRINSVDDFLKVKWDGAKWRIVANNGTVGY